jgi:ABC-type lipoprotein release transport system permease subunit
MVIVPLVKAIAGALFQAAFTWNTSLAITVVTITVGIVFGTYPAMQVVRLHPVEAIQREWFEILF